MTVCRAGNKGEEAIMCIGIDEEPDAEVCSTLGCGVNGCLQVLTKFPEIKGVMEFAVFKEM